jgi:glycosyltransferase involved in cell wall biosynthesis
MIVGESRPLVSVVTPCYNEEEGIADCYRAVRQVFEDELPGYHYEHVFCDNASTDETLAILKGIAAVDVRVRIIANARNFGPLASNLNGVLATRGDAVLVAVPADLQDPPELIPEFLARWREGYEVVCGVRAKRHEGWAMRNARRLFYRIVRRSSTVAIPVDVGEFQLIDRKVVEALRGFDDYYPYLRGMIAACGFRSTGIPFAWRGRSKGMSKARFLGLLDFAANGLISFSKLPIRLGLAAGLLLMGGGLAWGTVSLAVGSGWLAPLVVGLTGMQMTYAAVVGEYVAATHAQVRRRRPVVIERERVNFDADDAARPVPPPKFRGVAERDDYPRNLARS